ncbi:MAG: hypothetical protein ACHQRM_00540 [Bacteroidia bacterium]
MKNILVVIAFVILLPACTLEKRHYSNGYYLEWAKQARQNKGLHNDLTPFRTDTGTKTLAACEALANKKDKPAPVAEAYFSANKEDPDKKDLNARNDVSTKPGNGFEKLVDQKDKPASVRAILHSASKKVSEERGSDRGQFHTGLMLLRISIILMVLGVVIIFGSLYSGNNSIAGLFIIGLVLGWLGGLLFLVFLVVLLVELING